jgi:hypothetical protein
VSPLHTTNSHNTSPQARLACPQGTASCDNNEAQLCTDRCRTRPPNYCAPQRVKVNRKLFPGMTAQKIVLTGYQLRDDLRQHDAKAEHILWGGKSRHHNQQSQTRATQPTRHKQTVYAQPSAITPTSWTSPVLTEPLQRCPPINHSPLFHRNLHQTGALAP